MPARSCCGPAAWKSQGSVLMIVGPFNDIPIREVDIPANAMTDATGRPITTGYQITDTCT